MQHIRLAEKCISFGCNKFLCGWVHLDLPAASTSILTPLKKKQKGDIGINSTEIQILRKKEVPYRADAAAEFSSPRSTKSGIA